MSSKPEFIGVGVQKCGTTWIHQILKEHPDVFVAESDEKDTRFFSYFFDHGFEWYERFFEMAAGKHVAGEISTSYFYDADAPGRIFSYNPEAKIIICLRNPMERIISNHKHEIRVGHIDKGASLEFGLSNNPTYIDQSRYFTHIKRWLQFFPKEQMLILLFDDLRENPAQFAKEIYSFVGVDTDFMPSSLDTKVNEGFIPRSRAVHKVVPQLTKFVRSIGLGSIVDRLKAAGVKHKMKQTNNEQPDPTDFTLSNETKTNLQSILHHEIDELSKLLDRDLSCWH